MTEKRLHPIQEEPESTVGTRPDRVEHPERAAPARQGSTRSGAAIRSEEGDETEAGSEIREREQDEPPTERGLEE